jgi:hypothetical protein
MQVESQYELSSNYAESKLCALARVIYVLAHKPNRA